MAAYLEEALVTRLKGWPGLSTLSADRVFPRFIPGGKDKLPAIGYLVTGRAPNYVMSGETGSAEQRAQFSCWAKSYADAVAMADQVRLALSGIRTGLSNIVIDSLFIENAQDIHDLEPGVEQSKTYGVRVDVRVRFRQTAASN